MTNLPDDLLAKIDELFDRDRDRDQVRNSLETLWDGGLNVGPEQLARAIVFLSDGDFERFQKLRSSFMGDPRDLLAHANSKLQNSDYWFSSPFSEMGPIAVRDVEIPDPDRHQADESRPLVRIAAAIPFAVLLFVGFYAFVTLAFGISYREPLLAIVLYGTALLCVIFVEIYLAQVILSGTFSKPVFLIRSALLAVASFLILLGSLIWFH